MTKFIEVHINGASYLINLAHSGSDVVIAQDYMIIDETYEQIKRKISEGNNNG